MNNNNFNSVDNSTEAVVEGVNVGSESNRNGSCMLSPTTQQSTSTTAKFSPKPYYTKRKRFIIIKKLLEFISDKPEIEKKKYCIILDKIIILTKANPLEYCNIHKTYWKNMIGDNYKKYITDIESWNLIKVNEYYHYKLNENDSKESICKGYKLDSSTVNEEKIDISFDNHSKSKKLKDKSIISDSSTEFIYNNLQRIGVKEHLVVQNSLLEDVESEQWANKIFDNVFNMHYGKKTSRLYHSIITMPKTSRKNLILKSSPTTPLFEYDIKSALPVMLLQLIKDEKESNFYKTLLNQDIYSIIAKVMNINKNRKTIKVDFMKFINGGSKNYFYKYFNQHMPIFTNIIINSNVNLAEWYQNLESSIMIKTIPDLLMKEKVGGKPEDNDTKNLTTFNFICGREYLTNVYKGVLYVPMHDGWLGIEAEEDIIISQVKSVFLTLTGYEITITKEKIDSNDKSGQNQGPDTIGFDWAYDLKLDGYHTMKKNISNIIKRKVVLGRKFYNNDITNSEKMKFYDLNRHIKLLKKNLREYKKLNKIKESVRL